MCSALLSIRAQKDPYIPFKIRKAEKRLGINNVDSVLVLLVDSLSGYGLYKILYYDNDKKKRGINFIFVDQLFYKEIYYHKGINRYYNKGHCRLKKYLKSEELKKVDSFFLERYPPKI
jgi:hypothetical protein